MCHGLKIGTPFEETAKIKAVLSGNKIELESPTSNLQNSGAIVSEIYISKRGIIAENTDAGDTTILVNSNDFEIGNFIVVSEGTNDQEVNRVVGVEIVTSDPVQTRLTLKNPLVNNHLVGNDVITILSGCGVF